jgi:hypothetical protein
MRFAAAVMFIGSLAPAYGGLIVMTNAQNQLLTINSATPGTILSTVGITGLQGGENILGIDFRPATLTLYGLGSSNRLYTINTTTGAATQVGSAGRSPCLEPHSVSISIQRSIGFASPATWARIFV